MLNEKQKSSAPKYVMFAIFYIWLVAIQGHLKYPSTLGHLTLFCFMHIVFTVCVFILLISWVTISNGNSHEIKTIQSEICVETFSW